MILDAAEKFQSQIPAMQMLVDGLRAAPQAA